LKQSELFEAPKDSKLRGGPLAALGPDPHPLAAVGISPDGGLDQALISAYQPMDEGQIFFVHLARLKLLDKPMISLIALGKDHHPAGLLIEAMDHPGPPWRPHPRKPPAFKEPLEQRAVGMAGRRIDHNPGGLIHHHQVIVFVYDREIHLLGLKTRPLRRELYLHTRPWGKGRARLGLSAA